MPASRLNLNNIFAALGRDTIVREVLFSFEMLKTQCNCAKSITTPGNVKPSKLERHRQLSDVAKGRRLKFEICCHLFDGD